MEARYSAAGDRDEQEREQRAGEHGPGTVDEARGLWHCEWRRDDVNANCERADRTDLEERTEVVARREHQPYRQARRDGTVDDQRPGELGSGQREQWCKRRACRHIAPE